MQKIIKLILISMITFLAFNLNIYSTVTGSVEGYIKDAQTGDPIPKAKIIIVSSKSQMAKKETFSNQKGHFYRAGLTPENYMHNPAQSGQ